MANALPVYLGIDPGFSGAVACLENRNGRPVLISLHELEDTPHGVAAHLRELAAAHYIVGCCLEHVHSFPRQGIASTFKFGVSYGMCIGMLAAIGIPYMTVSPLRWQRSFGLKAKGDKKVAAATASALLGEEVKVKCADAVLLGIYCMRHWNGESYD